jgi:hypothetical protein
MEPPSYMRSVVGRNVGMRRMTVLFSNTVFLTAFQSLLTLNPRNFSLSFPATSTNFKSYTFNMPSVNNSIYLAPGSKMLNPLNRNSQRSRLRYDTAYIANKLPTFRRKLLPQTSLQFNKS